MFKPTEFRGEGEMLEKPADELADVRNKIAAAERGVDLANQLNDMERLAQMMAKLQELRAEEQAIQHRLNEEAANASAFDEATSREQISRQSDQDRKIA